MPAVRPTLPSPVAASEAERFIPATVAAEITGDCEGPGRDSVPHRIWIQRDGSIIAPDHQSDSAAEQVAQALGDEEINFCQHWLRLNDSAGRSGKSLKGTPHRTLPSWAFTYESFWTPQGAWTALAGILNSITFSPISPGSALAYAQAYVSRAGRLPTQAFEHFANLATPWARQQGGYRRRTAVTPQELEALLDAGVPVDNAAVFAVLDLDADAARRGMRALRGWGHPPDLLIRLCYALPPEKALLVLEGLSEERGRRLPSLLTDLATAIESGLNWPEEHIVSLLLGH